MNGTTRNVKKYQVSYSKTNIVSMFVPGAANGQFQCFIFITNNDIILLLLSGIALSTVIL